MKKIRLRSPGVSSATRVASSNCFGCAAQERRDEIELAQLAADGLGDLLAAVAGVDAEQARRRVDDLSRRGRSSSTSLPRGRPSCGSALNSRLGVNGIQYSSSEMRFVAAWSWIVSSAWPMVVSGSAVPRIPAGGAAGGGVVLGSIHNPTPLSRRAVPGHRPPASRHRRFEPSRRVDHHATPRFPIEEQPPCASASRKRSRSSKTVSASCPAACASSWRTATRSLSSTTRDRASGWTTTPTARPGRRSSAPPPRCSPRPT